MPPTPAAVLEQLADGAAVEEAALDRAALDDGALLGLEPVDARGEQRLDRRRHGVVGARGRRAKCASSCSTKSGLPSAVATTRSRSSGASSCGERVDELVRVVVAERLEHDERRARRAAPPRTAARRRGRAAQCRARRSARRWRRRRRTRRGRAAPGRPSGCRRRRARAAASRRASRRAGGTPRRSRRASRRRWRSPTAPATSRAATSPCRVASSEELGRGRRHVAHDIGERQVGDAVAVGRCSGRRRSAPRRRASRAARARAATCRSRACRRSWQACGARRDRGVERGAEPRELVASSDERRRDRPA